MFEEPQNTKEDIFSTNQIISLDRIQKVNQAESYNNKELYKPLAEKKSLIIV